MSKDDKKNKPLRSTAWFGKPDKDGFLHRSWIKNQGYPDDLFDGLSRLSPEWILKNMPELKNVRYMALGTTCTSMALTGAIQAVGDVDHLFRIVRRIANHIRI